MELHLFTSCAGGVVNMKCYFHSVASSIIIIDDESHETPYHLIDSMELKLLFFLWHYSYLPYHNFLRYVIAIFRFFVHIGMEYLFTFWACFLLYKEYDRVASMRLSFLASQGRHPAQFTVSIIV